MPLFVADHTHPPSTHPSGRLHYYRHKEQDNTAPHQYSCSPSLCEERTFINAPRYLLAPPVAYAYINKQLKSSSSPLWCPNRHTRTDSTSLVQTSTLQSLAPQLHLVLRAGFAAVPGTCIRVEKHPGIYQLDLSGSGGHRGTLKNMSLARRDMGNLSHLEPVHCSICMGERG